MSTKIELDGKCKLWIVELTIEEIFNTVSLLSNYLSREDGKMYSCNVLLNDDKEVFFAFMNQAKNAAWLSLARMSKDVVNAIVMEEDKILMKFKVSNNHDDNILEIFGGFVQDYIISLILKYWNETNGLMDEAMKYRVISNDLFDKILTAIHYRKKCVRRPIDPVF